MALIRLSILPSFWTLMCAVVLKEAAPTQLVRWHSDIMGNKSLCVSLSRPFRDRLRDYKYRVDLLHKYLLFPLDLRVFHLVPMCMCRFIFSVTLVHLLAKVHHHCVCVEHLSSFLIPVPSRKVETPRCDVAGGVCCLILWMVASGHTWLMCWHAMVLLQWVIKCRKIQTLVPKLGARDAILLTEESQWDTSLIQCCDISVDAGKSFCFEKGCRDAQGFTEMKKNDTWSVLLTINLRLCWYDSIWVFAECHVLPFSPVPQNLRNTCIAVCTQSHNELDWM